MTTVRATHRPVPSPSLSRRDLLLRATAAGLAAPALAALVAPGALAAAWPAPASRVAGSLSERLDAVLAAGIEGGLPGVVLSVERAGKSVYLGAAGVASVEQETPVTTTDRFLIYSIGKAFTATVVLQLVDEGVLSLDDTVDTWLDDPAVARIPHVDEATVRQLLNHTSGMYDFADDEDSSFWADAFLGEGADWTKVWTTPELLAYADGANHAPYFAPGESYHYSNTGYLLLGLIVEAATGRPFGKELDTRVLKPLTLKDTSLEMGATLPDDMVDGYQMVGEERVNVSAINLTWDWTAGGMVSAAADLARFGRAVFDGELLSPASFEEMFALAPDPVKPQKAEGMGIYRIETPNGALIGMDGTGPGGNALVMRLPEADLTVVVLANLAPDGGATEILRDEAIRVVLESA